VKWRAFYELVCRHVDTITYPTAFTRDEAVRISPGIAKRATVVPNGYEPQVANAAEWRAMRDAARLRLGFPPDAFIIGNAGWLIPRKRFDVFLETAAVLRTRLPQARFVICGDGPDRHALEALASRLGLSDVVTFAGWVSDLTDYYRAWDVLLFNSDFDTLPCAPMEAASHGCPTVASLVSGGLDEFIADERTGILLREHDTGRLADALALLATEESRLAALRVGALATLRANFSTEIGAQFYAERFV
jgi:glycosyltransferase involved in cell wall biosynthesis